MSIVPIQNGGPWKQKVSNAVGYWNGTTAPDDYEANLDAFDALNAVAADMGLPLLVDGESRLTARGKINDIIAGLGIPTGLDFYADFETGRYWDGQAWAMADKVTDTWSGGELLNAAGDYESFERDELSRNELGLWTQPTRTNLFANSIFAGTPGNGTYPTGWTRTGQVAISVGATLLAEETVKAIATQPVTLRRVNATGFEGLQQVVSVPAGTSIMRAARA